MQPAQNRAIALWQNWGAKEKMLQEVFGNDKGLGNFEREKYEFLSAGLDRISPLTEPDERLVAVLIGKSLKRLEKELYPHPLMRIAHRVKWLVWNRALAEFNHRQLKNKNIAALDKAVSALGIDIGKVDLRQVLDFEKQQIDIPLSSALGTGKWFGLVLHLEKDGLTFRLQGYSAKLENSFDPTGSRSFGFDATLGISPQQALSLLQGRAVVKDFVTEDFTASKWLQLDFSAGVGSPVLREFGESDRFSLSEHMEKIANGLNRPELLSAHFLKAMEQGNQVVIKDVLGAKVYLEASPLSGKILLRDERHRMVSMEKVIRAKEKSLELKPELKITKVKQKQQSQSLGIA